VARDDLAARVAKAAGTKRIVKLSTMDVEQGVGTGAWHAKGESAICTSWDWDYICAAKRVYDKCPSLGATSIKAEGIVRSVAWRR